MFQRSIWTVISLAALAGCSNQGDAHGIADKAKSIPVTAAFEPTEGDEVRITLTTEGNADLVLEAERGTLNAPRLRAEPDGTAVVFARGAVGANTLKVDVRIDGRETQHAFPFTTTFVDKVVFEDATPARDGMPMVSCQGDLLRDRKPLSLCSRSLGLADDGTIGLSATASSLQKLTIGDQTFEAKAGKLVARIDLTQAIRSLDLMFVDDEHPLELPATLVLSTGTFSGTLELGTAPIEAMFTKAKRGPVLFPGEAARPGRASLLLISDGEWAGVGKSVPLDQVDLVAFDRWSYREAPACEYVRPGSTEVTKSVARSMRDHVIEVRDRRTGKQLGIRRFLAPTPSCEQWVKTDTKDSFVEADERERTAWVENFVTR